MKNKGFTLTELMIGVAIVGLLAAVAVPSFQEQMLVSKRSDAIAATLALQLAEQKFRGNCVFYAQTLGNADVCGASAGASTITFNELSGEGYYKLAVSGATGNAYKITATPQGSQTSDTSCNPMTLTVSAANPSGLKAPAGCW